MDTYPAGPVAGTQNEGIDSPIKLEESNRVVDIVRTVNSNGSWRYLFADILNTALNIKSDTQVNPQTIYGNDVNSYSYPAATSSLNATKPSRTIYTSTLSNSKQYIVKPNVYLLLENKVTDININNKLITPIQDLISSGSKLLDGASEVSEGKAKAILEIAKYTIKSIPGLYNLLNLSGLQNGETSSTFYPWVQNLPAWEPSANNILSFNYTFNFALGQYGLWNAKEEVFLPILNLLTPVLPRYLSYTGISGPIPNMIQMLSNTAGDVVNAIITNIVRSLREGNKTSALLGSYSNYSYTVNFGKFLTLRNVLIKDAKVTFGNEVDEEGYPVSGSITLTFQSIIPPALSAKSKDILAVRFFN